MEESGFFRINAFKSDVFIEILEQLKINRCCMQRPFCFVLRNIDLFEDRSAHLYWIESSVCALYLTTVHLYFDLYSLMHASRGLNLAQL